MIIELGHFALILALVLSVLQAVVPMAGAVQGRRLWMALGQQTAWSILGLCTISLLALAHAYALSDFSVLNVVQNSHTLKPLLYKLTGVWGNHEGSLLLWVWMLALWSMLAARRGSALPAGLQARVLSVQGMITSGFLLFILLTSNPFLRIDPAPVEGLGLNPVLQDIALAIHPPFLYAGYVGFSIAFCFAIAALLEKKIDSTWAAFIRPWVLAAWVALTVGITIGSVWAYYELGWGGFWFWDPVENAALMPWLSGTALLHCVAVLQKRGALKNWTIFLAILTFSLSLLGTFLVRSGVLTSVHAFAVDPERGIFILALLAMATGGGLFLYALRAPYIRSTNVFRIFSRETMLLLNNVFLFAIVATVFMGTLYPLFLSALNAGSISVSTPYYTAVLVPLMVPFALLMGAAPAVAWRAGHAQKTARRLVLPALVTLGFALVLVWSPMPATPVVLACLVPAAWILCALAQDVYRKTGGLRGWRFLPVTYYAMVVAHAGFALLMIGATAATQWGTEKILWMSPQSRVEIAGHKVVFLSQTSDLGWNYNRDLSVFAVHRDAESPDYYFMQPEKRWYPESEKQTSEAALRFIGLDMLYIVMGDQDAQRSDRWVVRIYHHPFIGLLFGGAGLIALGGFLALLSGTRRRGTV